MRYLSICSGIEAASVAWRGLGWKALAFSEIEDFPRAVLAHHYPDVPLYGDFTELRHQPWIVHADILVGGTPCQAFSVAGLRNSLADDRGNLTLEYVRLADAIDDLRRDAGREPAYILWENVPGVLSVADNAFGAFLAGLCGCDAPLVSPNEYGWSDAGVVAGPKRWAAWRILDAQYYGLAQRRRRVFVLARGGAGGWRCADALLPIVESMQWNPPPRRQAGQGAAATLAASAGGCSGKDAIDGRVIPSTGDVSHCLNAGGMGRIDYETETVIAHALRADGFDASEDGTGRGTPLVPVQVAPTLRAGGNATGGDRPYGTDVDTCDALLPVAAMPLLEIGKGSTSRGDGPNGAGFGEIGDPMFTLQAGAQHGVAIAFDETQITSPENRCKPQSGDPCHPLAAGARPPTICFSAKDHGADAMDDLSPTLRAGGFTTSHANAGVMPVIAFNARQDPDVFDGHTGPLDTDGSTHAVLHSGGNNASPSQANSGALLRGVREALGEKAFAEWGLGILDTIQSAEILRSALHGSELRPASFSRRWVVCCALGSPVSSAEGAVQSMREAGCSGRSPQGWQPSEQRSRELGAYLSELSQPGAQAERFMRDLWLASEGVGLLRQALSAVQEARRSSRHKDTAEAGMSLRGASACERHVRQALHADAASWRVRRLLVEECEFLQGFPRGYTNIAHRGKPSADGPRYRALGNSMAVNVMRWIGQRIAMVDAIPHANREAAE